MPSKRLRRARHLVDREPDPLVCFCWSRDGCENPFGEPAYPSRIDAERAWQIHRRAVWARTPRFRIPEPAEVYDGLSLRGHAFIHSHWNHLGAFRLSSALAAVAADRTALAAFRMRDPSAKQIADFLRTLEADLNLTELTARDFATCEGDRLYPHHLSTVETYGAIDGDE